MTLEQRIDGAILAARSDPEQVDAVIWLLLRPGASRRLLDHAVDELKDVYVTQHMCLADLVFWFVDGEPGLMKQLKDTGAMSTLYTTDAHEWLSSLAWLLVKVQGHINRLDVSKEEPNWLSRSKMHHNSWYGLGICPQYAEGSDGREPLRITVYNAPERLDRDFLYRVCCFNRTEDWKGLSHLGIEHEWEDCLPHIVEDNDYDEYEDDYE